jgi:hypothetical protein
VGTTTFSGGGGSGRDELRAELDRLDREIERLRVLVEHERETVARSMEDHVRARRRPRTDRPVAERASISHGRIARTSRLQSSQIASRTLPEPDDDAHAPLTRSVVHSLAAWARLHRAPANEPIAPRDDDDEEPPEAA